MSKGERAQLTCTPDYAYAASLFTCVCLERVYCCLGNLKSFSRADMEAPDILPLFQPTPPWCLMWSCLTSAKPGVRRECTKVQVTEKLS
jgi:hypothetical protein